MVTAASFLTTLPSASLAVADFPRFITRALNRRAHDELPQLLALLEAQTLSGYPANVAPVLRLIVQAVREQGLDPTQLDPVAVRRLMTRRDWLDAADSQVGLERTPLRPGEPLGRELSDMGPSRVRLIPGQGQEHYLVTASQLLQLPGLGWSHVDGLIVARPMDEDEAAELRRTWAVIEEHFGFFEAPQALPWQAELTRIAARNNLQAETCREILQAMSVDSRRRLWRVLLEHLRDAELDDAHRPSLRTLGDRLRAADLSLLGARLDHVLALAESAYLSCRFDPAVAEGLCPCNGGDLALYGQWTEVPQGSRDRLLAMTPQLVEYQLRRLAEVENHGADLNLTEELRRDLRGLRDGCLRRRYAHDLSGIIGVDPLLLAEERLREGHDRGAILRDMTELARRVGLAAAELRGDGLTSPAPKSTTAPMADGSGLIRLVKPSARRQTPLRRPRPPASTAAKPPAATEDSSKPSEYPDDAAAARARRLPQSAPAVTEQPASIQRLPSLEPITERHIRAMELPPLPKPPPWRRTMTKPNITAADLPPMPSPPTGPAPTEALNAQRPQPVLKPPIRPRRTRPTTTRIITPAQTEQFYSQAFRELEVLERDLLERGPWPQARERLEHLQREARELTQAAGPAARSGDTEFAAALQRIRLVQAYLDRVVPLLEKRPTPPEQQDSPKRSASKRRRWFFQKNEEQ